MNQSKRQRINRIISSIMTFILVFTQFPLDEARKSYAEPGEKPTIKLQDEFSMTYGMDGEIPVSVNRIDGEKVNINDSDLIVRSDNEDIIYCTKELNTGNIKITHR
ncbi:MAG: hypothetical protein K6F55_03635, partial [Eubacterium sp.]|nr:hypothetical protein [Eubacterium sp.]